MVSKVFMREMYRMKTGRARLIKAKSRAGIDFFLTERKKESCHSASKKYSKRILWRIENTQV
ncbi:MAG: hypothetical protein D3925_09600 [Candidatus Electrothrix sp. AR5]|nr:hypothetical protein [Candidatus Electrothrix sp. AR5]